MMAGRKHTGLVVDDDDAVRRVLGQWVLKLGYELTSANSAEAAIGLLETTEVDVALCDIRMPGADGIWLANHMRERFPDVAIVLVTGGHEMDPSVTLRPGVVAYVIKPFGHDAIASAIKAGVARREDQTALPRPPALLDLIDGSADDCV